MHPRINHLWLRPRKNRQKSQRESTLAHENQTAVEELDPCLCKVASAAGWSHGVRETLPAAYLFLLTDTGRIMWTAAFAEIPKHGRCSNGQRDMARCSGRQPLPATVYAHYTTNILSHSTLGKLLKHFGAQTKCLLQMKNSHIQKNYFNM